MKDCFVFLAKLFSLLLALSAAVYFVVTYWDKISDFLTITKQKVSAVAGSCCGSDYEDYADWDGE